MAKRSRTKRRAKLKAKTIEPTQQNSEAKTGDGIGTELSGTGSEQENAGASSPAIPTAFEQVIAQSKAAIEEESAQRTGARRGRGRPPKHRPVSTAPSQGTTSGAAQPTSSLAPQAPVAPPPDISKALVLPLIAVSKIPARSYQCDDLVLTEEEAAACADALNNILTAFVPDQNAMSPKTAAVVMGAITFGSIGFSKYLILQQSREAQKAKIKEKEQVEVQDVIRAEQERAQTTAADFYRREVTA